MYIAWAGYGAIVWCFWPQWPPFEFKLNSMIIIECKFTPRKSRGKDSQGSCEEFCWEPLSGANKHSLYQTVRCLLWRRQVSRLNYWPLHRWHLAADCWTDYCRIYANETKPRPAHFHLIWPRILPNITARTGNFLDMRRKMCAWSAWFSKKKLGYEIEERYDTSLLRSVKDSAYGNFICPRLGKIYCNSVFI